MRTEHTAELQAGDHVRLDGNLVDVRVIVGRRLDAAGPSGVSYKLAPDAGGCIDAGRVTYVSGYTEHSAHDSDDDEDEDLAWRWWP